MAIGRAVTRANRDRRATGEDSLPRWNPYQLRHACLTRVRLEHGLEAAAAIGGHSTTRMTEGYSYQAEGELARNIAAEMG